MLTAWYRFLWNRVTIKRNTTVQSDTGTSKFSYTTLFTDVPCNVQDGGGGRMSQEEFGQKKGHKHKITFGPEMIGLIQVNDLLVFADNSIMRVVHHYEASHYGETNNHMSVDAETYVPQGDV